MKTFTGYEYLLIDAANQFGLDKLTFEERIQWAKDNLSILNTPEMISKADTKPLYVKAVLAIEKAHKKLPTGHLVGFDACCSGTQLMSVLTGCYAGATHTGLIDPDVRADAYTSLTEEMQNILGASINVERKDSKQAFMTVMYGSRAKPIEIYGENTPELNAFYEAAYKIAPGAWGLLQDLKSSWRAYSLKHEWVLPDGYEASVKVMQEKEVRIQVEELNNSSFTYIYYANEGSKTGISNVANVIHSIDAYVLRTIHRMCNYNAFGYDLSAVYDLVKNTSSFSVEAYTNELESYVESYAANKLADISVLPKLTADNVYELSQEHLKGLMVTMERMMEHKSFEVVTIHDEFKCHPNNMNVLRNHYRHILADLADSTLMQDILSQLYQENITYTPLMYGLSKFIRESNYGLS